MQYPMARSLPIPSSQTCFRETVHAPKQPEEPVGDTEAVEMVALEIGNEEQIEAYYESAFKQVKHPYNGGRGVLGEKGDPEKTKPDWWPAGVIHREPDYLQKPERIRLLIYIFRKLSKSYGITADKLEEAGRDIQRQIKPRERLDILDKAYMVRRAEECYERGEAGADITLDANAIIYVAKRDTKTEKDSKEMDGTTGATYDPIRHPTARKRKREVEVPDTEFRTRPPSPVMGSIEGISVSHARLSFAIHSSGECRDIEKKRSSQLPPCISVKCSPPSVGTTDITQWFPTPEPTYSEHLGFYGSRKPLDGMDYPDQYCAQEFTLGHGCHTAWNPRNLGPEYVPQVYMNTQGTVDS
ncbi:hypothetical protein H112_00420 [Trichophyton rubrum D6]|uniref:Subtelomeric hrmA-associated cluster protein AFUB-079030/YDR124W-like helical bundle domain-containing protein n=1 Tax=Trichophyton rubrum CBS 288.86 TaxID=1215330 RepID=A0A022WFY2_TRIRU|nr:hypothetical protein H100_00419 [Trichophyton rubrum MR850]EZF46730.1 hypothetical protein H102_00418 [Trichophyton rubrum CBS 100081]EZF57310.1 hypothetical protein H103_00418 [Trichophyton rubrum CBS 288.86]EZG21597.1 hypothetical protein H107_00459 [Trichophyton rubrum CBS 202.88]KDB38532.1 hypothetical protein H112_00420 [Trichophyton rubrum D6]